MKLKNIENNCQNLTIASARTCYSSKLIGIEDVKDWERKDGLTKDLLDSGHHTTFQHKHFTIQIEGMSRLLIWRLLHNHPYYNSDQVSQRYTPIKIENFYNPNNISEVKEYYEFLFIQYQKLVNILEKDFEKDKNPIVRKNAKKKAQENARYIIPMGALANLYHTVNSTVMLRYIAFSKIIPEAKEESKKFAENLKKILIEDSPIFEELIKSIEKINLEPIKNNIFNGNKYKLKKDINVCNNSHLTKDLERFCTLEEIEKSLDEKYKIADKFNIFSLYPTESSLDSFKTKYKISLTADAQNQRHRTSKAIRLPLKEFLTLEKNKIKFKYYTPEVIKNNKEALEIYESTMRKIEKMLYKYTENDIFEYLLPNAMEIYIKESTDLYNFSHKANKRLCLNSQDEIRNITEKIIKDLNIKIFEPPCVTNYKNKVFPICPEGNRFCGVKYWKEFKIND